MRRTLIRRNIGHAFEGMPRYPQLSVMGGLRGLDYMGTCVFAVSGSVTAATCGLDLLGATVVGCITALGGGTVRDVLWGRCPAFWLDETEYLYMSIVCAFGAFCFCYFDKPEGPVIDQILFWGDTIGLGAFAVIGTMYACRLKCSIVITLLCTMITCTGGGIIRDTLCRRPARVLHAHAEVYAETAVFGGVVYLLTRALGVPLALRTVAGVLATVSARIWASTLDVRGPVATPVIRN